MSFSADAHIVIQTLNNYFQESVSQKKPVIRQVPLNQLVKELNLAFWTGQGSFHLSTTVFKSKRYLRMVFMSPHTGMEQVKQLIKRVRELAEEVKRKNEG